MISLIAEAILPIAWVLAMGVLIKAKGWLDEAAWRGMEWLSYWVLMPSLLIAAIIQAPALEVPWGPLLGSLYGVLAVLTLILLLAWKVGLLGQSYPAFTSVYQGVIRFNTFVALALMAGLHPAGLPQLAIAAACIIVVINIGCVTVMTAGHAEASLRRVLIELARNPLILACLIGGVGRILGVPGGFPVSGLELLGKAALPVGILVLGGGLQWHALKQGAALTLLTTGLQLCLKPMLFLGLASLFGLPQDWVLVGLLLMAVSTAPSSYILAKQLGGDASLMAGVVATQTVLAIGSVPLVLAVSVHFGWVSW